MPEFTSHLQGTPSWAELATTDEQGALAFYTAMFGWVDEPNEMGPGIYYHMQKLNGLEVAAMYQQGDDERQQGVPAHWKVYFTVDDIQQSAEKAKESGASVLFGPIDVFDAGHAARSGTTWHPTALAPEAPAEGMDYLKEQAVKAGRDPSEISVSVSAAIGSTHNHNRYSLGEDPEEILERAKKYQEMGLERLLISPNTRDQSQLRPIMEMLAEVVIPAVQS